MRDAYLGGLLVGGSLIAMVVAFVQGFGEEVYRFEAVACPIVAAVLLWMLILPKIGKGK